MEEMSSGSGSGNDVSKSKEARAPPRGDAMTIDVDMDDFRGRASTATTTTTVMMSLADDPFLLLADPFLHTMKKTAVKTAEVSRAPNAPTATSPLRPAAVEYRFDDLDDFGYRGPKQQQQHRGTSAAMAAPADPLAFLLNAASASSPGFADSRREHRNFASDLAARSPPKATGPASEQRDYNANDDDDGDAAVPVPAALKRKTPLHRVSLREDDDNAFYESVDSWYHEQHQLEQQRDSERRKQQMEMRRPPPLPQQQRVNPLRDAEAAALPSTSSPLYHDPDAYYDYFDL
jgi:hypothetical protein